MADAVPYIQEVTKFANIPGQLLRARQEANRIADPAIRQKTREFLDSIQKLDPETQANFLLFLRGARNAPTVVGRTAGPDPDDPIGQAVAGVINESLSTTETNVEYNPLTDELRLDTESAYAWEKDVLNNIKSLFPELEVKDVGPGVLERLSEDGADWIVEHEGVKQALNTAHDILRQRSSDKDYSLSDIGTDVLRVTGASAFASGDVGWDAAGSVVRKIPFVGDAVADFSGRQARAAEKQLAQAVEASGVMTAGMQPIGKDPVTGDPVFSLEDQRIIEARSGGFVILMGLTSIGVGSAIGKLGRRSKTAARAAGRPAAEAALESSRSIRRGGALGTAAESYRMPIREMTKLLDRGLVQFTKDPEKFFARGLGAKPGKRLIATLAEARKAHPGDSIEAIDGQVGFMRQAYGEQLNSRLARKMLEQPTEEGAKRVFISTLMNDQAGRHVIRDLHKERVRVKQRLNELQQTAPTRAARRAEAQRKLLATDKEVRATPEVPEELRSRIREAVDEYEKVVAEEREFERLRLSETDIEWRLATTFDDDPMFKYPKQSVVRAMVRQAPVSRLSKFIYHVYLNNRQGGIRLDKLTDELARFQEIPVVGSINVAPNALKEASNAISNYMQRAGVPPRIIEERLGELARVSGRSQFYDLLEKKIFGKGGDIDNTLHPKFAPELRERLINLHDTPIEGRTRSWITETVEGEGGTRRTRRPVLGIEQRPGEFTPIPSRDTEFINTLRLPDVDLLVEANSWLRRSGRALERSGKLGSMAYQGVWRLPQFLLNTSTLIFKPLVMLPRLLGAMPLRIQLEQVARMTGFGYKMPGGRPKGIVAFPGGIPVPLTSGRRVAKSLFGEDGWKLLDPDPRYDGFVEPEAPNMGMFTGEMMDDTPTFRTPQSTLEFRTGRRAPKREHWEAFRSELEEAHNSRIDSKLAQLDLDEKAFMQWLETDDWARRYMSVEQGPELEKAGVNTKQWVHSRVEYLKQLTKEDPKFLNTIAHGKTRALSRVGGDFDSSGRSVKALHDMEVEKVELIGQTIKEKLAERADNSEVIALQNERLLATRKIERMRRENPELLNGVKAIDLADKKRWHSHVKEEWNAGRMELPDTLFVENRLRAADHDGGRLDDWEAVAKATSNALYRPFKILSWADKHGTRGSLFNQAFARSKSQFLAHGYPEKTAHAMAYARAGEITKDLMYDLTARTSLQRALKDLMWFAPAYQEVLYTWLVKMPAEAHWPVGALSIALKGAGLIDILGAAGVVRKNSEGERVIVIPGMAALVEMLTGQRVPEVVYGKLDGLNLISTGGGVPGLSIPANFALGQAALKHGGIFKDISDIFQPYGPESSALPQPITFLTEAITGHPPSFEFLSPDRAKADWDRTFDIGMQYAYSEMAANGKQPPRPEDYGTKTADGWETTAAQRKSYEKANRSYWIEMAELAKRYQKGIAWVRAIGSTMAPMSLYATTNEREEWDNFWNKIIVPEGFGDQGMSDRQRDLIDTYIEGHPNSMAFSVFYRGQGEKTKELPFPEEMDDGFYDSYYTGESKTLSPKEYSMKLQATESRRYYQSQLDVALKDISPTGDPWVLLQQGFEKKDALADYYDNWNRYLSLNKEIDGFLTSQSELWRRNNNVPVESFEAERIGETLSLLRQISPMLTGEEGIRPEHLRRTLSDLGRLYSEEGDFGPANTPEEKALEWYFDEVYGPRVTEVSELYTEAEKLTSQGFSASHVYNKIRTIYDRPMPKYKGQVVPDIEAVSFGNRNPEERQAAILSWQSRPVSWLSDFQLEKSGYNITPAAKTFLRDISQYDEDMWNYINKNKISFSSKEYDDLKARRLRDLGAEAQRLGVTDIWNLNEAAPVFRLNSQGFGAGVSTWQSIASSVRTITSRIQAADLSPKGFSELASEQKVYLYGAISNARQSDKALDDLFVNLSHSFPMDGGGYREGAVLYEAVLFGNFADQYIPFDVASAAQV